MVAGETFRALQLLEDLPESLREHAALAIPKPDNVSGVVSHFRAHGAPDDLARDLVAGQSTAAQATRQMSQWAGQNDALASRCVRSCVRPQGRMSYGRVERLSVGGLERSCKLPRQAGVALQTASSSQTPLTLTRFSEAKNTAVCVIKDTAVARSA